MSHLLSRDKLEEQLPRMLSGVNSLYRKHTIAQYVTITQVRLYDTEFVKHRAVWDITISLGSKKCQTN